MAWFEDDDFWATFHEYVFSEARLRAAPDEVEEILALTGVSGGTVLDLACGVGRHAAAFAKRSFRVTAVDRTRASLDRARAHAAESEVEVEFVERDMRAFSRPLAFDLAVCLFTSFGYFETEEEELRVLRNVREALRPGGTFVLDVMGKEVLLRIFQETRSETAPDGSLLFWRTSANTDWTRIIGEWHAIKHGRAKSFKVDHWIYSGRELRTLMLEAGFRDVTLFGGFDGRAYDLHAIRLVAVGRT